MYIIIQHTVGMRVSHFVGLFRNEEVQRFKYVFLRSNTNRLFHSPLLLKILRLFCLLNWKRIITSTTPIECRGESLSIGEPFNKFSIFSVICCGNSNYREQVGLCKKNTSGAEDVYNSKPVSAGILRRFSPRDFFIPKECGRWRTVTSHLETGLVGLLIFVCRNIELCGVNLYRTILILPRSTFKGSQF